MHSVFYGKSPAYLENTVYPTSASASRLGNSLRSASSSDYTLLRLRTKFGERALSHAGPAAWNALPEHTHQPRLWKFLENSSKLIFLPQLLMLTDCQVLYCFI